MKKFIVSFFAFFVFVLGFAFSSTKLTFENGISLEFEPCKDGSIRFEATVEKPLHPTKEFELKREPAEKPFMMNADGSFSWENYVVLPEKSGYTLFYNGKPIYKSTFSVEKTTFKELREWKSATNFYGFGEASTSVNLSNQSMTIYNESKYGNHAFLFVPFYFTNENTSVYYNSNGRDKIYFQDGPDFQLYRTEYGRIECFVRQDKSAQDCVKKFYAETNPSCMLPKWAFGYIQSKYGYKSSEEVLQLVEDFKSHEIPLNAIVLDLFWFEKMGDIFWTSPDFSDYKTMNEKLESEGIKLITITEPFFGTESTNFKELKQKNLLAKNEKGKVALWRDWWCIGSKEGGVFNPLEKKASKFLGEKYAAMLDSGIDGFWTDLGEPEGAWNQKGLKYGKFAEQDFHNYYNYYWTKAIYDGVHEIYPEKRLFIMSRSGYTGIGKFNVSVWSGDVSVSWPSLSKQMGNGINAGLSGLPYWGTDVGGFTPESSPEELYIRWQQFGSFTPIYRAHGTGPREPYAYSEKALKIVKDLIDTRIALLPYIYSTARQTMSGVPMMRPIFFEDSSADKKYVETEYMFGDWILVSPIVKDSVSEKEHEFYLPSKNVNEGGSTIWYDFYTLEKTTSSEKKTSNTIEKIPVYIKEGAIIPCEKNGESCIFLIPSKNETNFTIYNDDGETEKYKNGDFSELEITLSENSVKAKLNGNKTFLSEKYILALPKSAKTNTTDWKPSQTDNHVKTKSATLEELLNGIEL